MFLVEKKKCWSFEKGLVIYEYKVCDGFLKFFLSVSSWVEGKLL